MFLLVFLAVLVGGLAWLSHRIAWAPHWSSRGRGTRVSLRVSWVRWAVPAAFTGLTGLAFLQFGAGPTFLPVGLARALTWVGATWLALALYLLLALVPVAFVSWLTGLAPRTDRPEWRQRIHRVGVPIAIVVALATTSWGLRSANDPVVSPRTVTAKDLPAAFDGVKVALITDLHVGPVRGPDFTASVVERVNAAKPDLVLIAGDLVDGPEWRYGPAIDPIKGLKAPLGVFGVTGNHESYTGTMSAWENRFKAGGITMLDNTHATVTKGADRIWLLGVRDFNGTGAFAPNYEHPLTRVAAGDFALLMAHQPRAALKMQGGSVDLQVSGHTHGGQLWPFRGLVRLQQPMVDGREMVGDVDVVTSRGVGTWGPPVRVGAAPEIPLITLKRG